VQPIRRIPYRLREKLEKKLREDEQYDIVEMVDGPSRWISPVVAIPKKNDEIRLCIDMRGANEAVIRERYCIPTIGEILQDLNQSFTANLKIVQFSNTLKAFRIFLRNYRFPITA
jgi:hypothetical protein